jgi:uncharacterized membrane protein
MKYILRFIVFAIVTGVAVGYYFKNTGDVLGDKIIGLSVLAFSFILLPLFLYDRYGKKDLSKYDLFPQSEEKDTDKK